MGRGEKRVHSLRAFPKPIMGRAARWKWVSVNPNKARLSTRFIGISLYPPRTSIPPACDLRSGNTNRANPHPFHPRIPPMTFAKHPPTPLQVLTVLALLAGLAGCGEAPRQEARPAPTVT